MSQKELVPRSGWQYLLFHPILHKLLNVEQDSDTSQQKAIKSAMWLNLQGRYTDSVEILLCKAAFLDHRMKSLPYLSEAQRDEVKNAICDEAEVKLICKTRLL